jgi:hypothetical protein
VKVEKLKDKPDWSQPKHKYRPTKYGFEKLEVGDLLTVSKAERTAEWRSFYVMATDAARRYGFKFKCRISENGDFQVYREA